MDNSRSSAHDSSSSAHDSSDPAHGSSSSAHNSARNPIEETIASIERGMKITPELKEIAANLTKYSAQQTQIRTTPLKAKDSNAKISVITDKFKDDHGIHSDPKIGKSEKEDLGGSKSGENGPVNTGHDHYGPEKTSETDSTHENTEAGSGGKPNPKIWNPAPTIQLCVVSIKSKGTKSINITMDSTPFDFTIPKPLREFKIINGALHETKERGLRPAARRPHGTKKEAIENKKGVADICTTTIQTWRKTSNEFGTQIKCRCHPAYFKERMGHHDKELCTINLIGALISEKIWSGGDVNGMEFEEELLM